MRNVFSIVDDLSAGLAALKASLQPLAAFVGVSNKRGPQRSRRTAGSRKRGGRRAAKKLTSGAASPKLKKRASRKPRKPVSAKVRAQRVQQGKYLAALRGLTVQQRAKVKKAKAAGDYASALKLASSLAKKSA
jgi:hypothetical protein